MEEIRKELSRLYEKHSELTPEVVVEAAKPKKSPLHDHFEWDDSKAAGEHRLWQARHLIRRVHLINVGGREQAIIHVPLKAATPEREAERGKYLVESDLVKDVDALQRAIDEAQRDLDAAIRRVAEARGLAGGSVAKFDLAIRSIEAAKLALAA